MGMSVRLMCMLALLCAGCSKAPHDARPPIPSIQCVPRGLGAAGLDAEWLRFAAHIHACVVVDPQGTPALEILAVSAQSFYREQPQGSAAVTMPRPAILLAGGKLVGRLPYNYPHDPPRTTTLEFSRWQAGLPESITMRARDPTVAAEPEVVLLLDVATGSYAQQ